MIYPNRNYWKNKKVLITGHTGFMGSWLSLVLLFYGAKVYGISLRPNTKPSLFEIMNIKKKIFKNYFADINDLNKMKSLFKSIQPKVVFHLAAQPIVKLSIKNPIETFKTNIIGTINICEASRKLNKLEKIIFVTTDKCYKNKNSKEIKFFNEEDELGGNDPYSASKACAEISINAYKNIYFKNTNVQLSTVRAGNIIGGGDWAENRLIPDIYRSINRNKILKIRYPEASRPWQHVLDVVNGYMILAQTKNSGSWNFGPIKKKIFRVNDILLEIKKTNFCLKWIFERPKKKEESINLNLNTKKAQKKLKWQPKWEIEQAINETNDWYKKFYEKKDIKKFTNQQIINFFKG
jgi:CDP-glucose 4,6-dehydratase